MSTRSTIVSVLAGILIAVGIFVAIVLTTADDTPSPTNQLVTTGATTTSSATTSSEGTTTSSEGTTTTEPTTTTSGFVGDTTTKSNDTPEGSPGPTLTDVRIGDHEGFVRVVLDFTGDGVPTYEVGYATPPFAGGGSGEEVPVLGSAYLKVRVMPGIRFDPNSGTLVYTGDTTLVPELDPIVEIQFIDDFESTMEWVVGLTSERPFTVTVLEGPLRLVIDIAK